MNKETLSFVTPPPPKNYKISSAFSYNFILALTLYEQLILKQITMKDYKIQKAAVDSELDRLREIHSRSEEHTSELQSPDNISYAVFCLKKKFF